MTQNNNDYYGWYSDDLVFVECRYAIRQHSGNWSQANVYNGIVRNFFEDIPQLQMFSTLATNILFNAAKWDTD